MVDQAILEYLDKDENHYGETAGDEPAKSFEEAKKKFKKEFDMVDLVSPAWTIQVPLRKKL
jgi:hypothetical protein